MTNLKNKKVSENGISTKRDREKELLAEIAELKSDLADWKIAFDDRTQLVTELLKEIEELKARIAKAVELPCTREGKGLGATVYQVVYDAIGGITTEQYGKPEQAEKRLKELEGGEC